jgi:hypothetical protein
MTTIPQKVVNKCCSCKRCQALNESTHEICSNCGKNKPITKRLEGGKVQCKSCYYKTYTAQTEMCSDCGESKPVWKRLEGGRPQCKSCYILYRMWRTKAHS